MSRAALDALDAMRAAEAAEAEARAAFAHDLAAAAQRPDLPDGHAWVRVLGADLSEPLVAVAWKDGEQFAWTASCWDNVCRRARDRHLLRLEGYARRAATREELFRGLRARMAAGRGPQRHA